LYTFHFSLFSLVEYNFSEDIAGDKTVNLIDNNFDASVDVPGISTFFRFRSILFLILSNSIRYLSGHDGDAYGCAMAQDSDNFAGDVIVDVDTDVLDTKGLSSTNTITFARFHMVSYVNAQQKSVLEKSMAT
jgi:hypothetical protein